MTNTGILILVEHFGDRQGLALGVSFMVMAIGGIVAPQIVNALLTQLSHHVSIMVFGGLILCGLIGNHCHYIFLIHRLLRAKLLLLLYLERAR